MMFSAKEISILLLAIWVSQAAATPRITYNTMTIKLNLNPQATTNNPPTTVKLELKPQLNAPIPLPKPKGVKITVGPAVPKYSWIGNGKGSGCWVLDEKVDYEAKYQKKLAELDASNQAPQELPVPTEALGEVRLISMLPLVITNCMDEPIFKAHMKGGTKCFCSHQGCEGPNGNAARMFATCIAAPLLAYYMITADVLFREFNLKKYVDEAICEKGDIQSYAEQEYGFWKIFNIRDFALDEGDPRPIASGAFDLAIKFCPKEANLDIEQAKKFWCDKSDALAENREVRHQAEMAYGCMVLVTLLKHPNKMNLNLVKDIFFYEEIAKHVCKTTTADPLNTKFLIRSHRDLRDNFFYNSKPVKEKSGNVVFVQDYYDLMYHAMRLIYLHEQDPEKKKEEVENILGMARRRCGGRPDKNDGWNDYVTSALVRAVCFIEGCIEPADMAVVKDYYDCLIGDTLMWSDFNAVDIRDKFKFHAIAYDKLICPAGSRKDKQKAMMPESFVHIFGVPQDLPAKPKFEDFLKKQVATCMSPQTLTFLGYFFPNAVAHVLCDGFGLEQYAHLITFRFYGCVMVEAMAAFHKTRTELKKEYDIDRMLHALICPFGKSSADEPEAKEESKPADRLWMSPEAYMKQQRAHVIGTKAPSEVINDNEKLPWSQILSKLGKDKKYGKLAAPHVQCKTVERNGFNPRRYDKMFTDGRNTAQDRFDFESADIKGKFDGVLDAAWRRCGGPETKEPNNPAEFVSPAKNPICDKKLEGNMIMKHFKRIYECTRAELALWLGITYEDMIGKFNFNDKFKDLVCPLTGNGMTPAEFAKTFNEKAPALPPKNSAELKVELISASTKCLDMVKEDTPNVIDATTMTLCYDLELVPAYQLTTFRYYACVIYELSLKYQLTRKNMRQQIDEVLHDNVFCPPGKIPPQVKLAENFAKKANDPLHNRDVTWFAKGRPFPLWGHKAPLNIV